MRINSTLIKNQKLIFKSLRYEIVKKWRTAEMRCFRNYCNLTFDWLHNSNLLQIFYFSLVFRFVQYNQKLSGKCFHFSSFLPSFPFVIFHVFNSQYLFYWGGGIFLSIFPALCCSLLLGCLLHIHDNVQNFILLSNLDWMTFSHPHQPLWLWNQPLCFPLSLLDNIYLFYCYQEQRNWKRKWIW